MTQQETEPLEALSEATTLIEGGADRTAPLAQEGRGNAAADKTHVVPRDASAPQDKTQPIAPTAQEEEEKKGLLSQMSAPPILAATLTAVTSFLLSKRLGLTGSLIGAAISAAVSALASQIYNAMINRSVERIHDLSEQMLDHTTPAGDDLALDRTQVRPPVLGLDELEAAETYAETGTPLAPDNLRERAAQRRSAALVRRAVAFTVVAAFLALGLYSAMVIIATQGEGIGPTNLSELGQPAVVEDQAGEAEEIAPEATDASTEEEVATPVEEDSTNPDALLETDQSDQSEPDTATGVSGQVTPGTGDETTPADGSATTDTPTAEDPLAAGGPTAEPAPETTAVPAE